MPVSQACQIFQHENRKKKERQYFPSSGFNGAAAAFWLLFCKKFFEKKIASPQKILGERLLFLLWLLFLGFRFPFG